MLRTMFMYAVKSLSNPSRLSKCQPTFSFVWSNYERNDDNNENRHHTHQRRTRAYILYSKYTISKNEQSTSQTFELSWWRKRKRAVITSTSTSRSYACCEWMIYFVLLLCYTITCIFHFFLFVSELRVESHELVRLQRDANASIHSVATTQAQNKLDRDIFKYKVNMILFEHNFKS